MKDFFFHPYLCLTHRFWRGEKSLFHFSLNFSLIGLNVWEHTLLINGHYTYSHILWHFYHLIDHSVTTIKKNGRLYCEWKCTPYFSFLRLFMLLTSSNESPLPLFSTYHLLHISFFETNINLWLTTTGIDVLSAYWSRRECLTQNMHVGILHFIPLVMVLNPLLHVYKNWNSG